MKCPSCGAYCLHARTCQECGSKMEQVKDPYRGRWEKRVSKLEGK